ncbi:TetR/AcrR family transcriptional regulator [Simiduia agarivorans]|uniref:TetR family transcriptional regulator n=1 Tax=Simiduia agarivorans (strain DSM 21679 / JCM 13881 / BCRC 17597 / SA1) TaxID=1117647 RepID=K4KFL1_SIMAS|nr:TetR/AcrR family transcriptional regulator [Simiduia agarivorans]AFU97864.1 TetR family transcriptional regulator [Simiduia agarivorans SA1 = DSM 21679]
MTSKPEKRVNSVNPRRQPIQARAKQRTRQILDVTARLLGEAGFDELTTILIAKELGISVGSLYHYFPNKQSILYALGDRWLETMSQALGDIEQFPLEQLDLDRFVDQAIDRMVIVYRDERAILPLAQAMWAVPELRELDERHDQMIIDRMMAMFRRLGFVSSDNELNRLGRVYLESTHALLLVVVNQVGRRSERTLADVKQMVLQLLRPHFRDDVVLAGQNDIEGPDGLLPAQSRLSD